MALFNITELPDENLLIGTLINRSAELYYTYGECGLRCNHPSGNCNDSFIRKQNCRNCSVNNALSSEKSCSGCCLECSEEVHFGKSWRDKAYRKEYDCQKLIYYYTCRYSWKYCSEIMYALEKVDLSKYGSYSVLSLGCGQSPDLMAFEQLNRRDGKNISYVGYDSNPFWETIHEEICTYCHNTNNMNCHFETIDVLEALQSSSGGFANVIIMSYLLSSFVDTDREKMVNQLFDLLIEKVLTFKGADPVLIILNDIDHRDKVRCFFDVLTKKLGEAGFHETMKKRHFKPREWDYHDGSILYENNSNKFYIPDGISNDFNCAIKCSSAQCIVEVL